MRLLLINHEYTISGASRMMLRLALHLQEAGHHCDVMAMASHDGPLRQEYESHGFNHLITTEFTAYDVVICNTIFSAPIVPAAAKFKPTIWWIHEGENGIDYILKRPADVLAFRDATAIVFQTEFQRDVIYRSFVFMQDPTKLFVIPSAVAVDSTGPSVPKTRALRIVSIGSIDARKRHGDLIRAVHALKRDDIECVIVGKYYHLGDEERAIAAAAPDTFKILGEMANAEALAWLRSADLFCLPSQVESQPISILEAALLGKPLVLTDFPPYRGIWRHRQNCLLVPVGDVGALAYSISALLTSPEMGMQLGRAARAMARRFGEAVFFARFDAMLAGLV
ncbi:MAG TPA: glycosyltransferase family 4 protein [Stellaceae bacterium]|nr:glycosyltransferase family 4 protein [Stellaceae bacterium]